MNEINKFFKAICVCNKSKTHPKNIWGEPTEYTGHKEHLTIGKEYLIKRTEMGETIYSYWLPGNDRLSHEYYPFSYFKTKYEIREEKIDMILK
jgi:hypothetical protein